MADGWNGRTRTSGLIAAAVAGGVAMSAGASFAQDTKLGEDPLSVILKWRPTASPTPMPEFVRKTRPPESDLHYTPLTGKEPDRPKTMTPAQLAETMKNMDAAAAGARARAARAFGTRKHGRRPARRAAPK